MTTRERFQGYIDVSAKRDADSLSKIIIPMPKEKKLDKNSLISQSYDGAAVMSGENSSLQTRIRLAFPLAIFIHCIAHRLNLVLSQACKKILESIMLFANLSALAKFFSMSSTRSKAFKRFMQRKLPRVTPLRWNYSGRLVTVVADHYEELVEFFDSTIEEAFCI